MQKDQEHDRHPRHPQKGGERATVTPDILRRAASELALIGKEGAEEEKLYLAFAEAQGRFKRVYAEFCAATSGEGSAVDDQGDYLGSLAEEEFSPKRAGEQTAELEEVAARLADVVSFRRSARAGTCM